MTMIPLSVFLALLALLPALGQTGSNIILKGNQWSVEINPSTLGVTGRFPDGAQVQISLGREGLGTATGINAEPHLASWDLPLVKAHFSAKIEGDRFFIEAVSSRAQEFAWPIIGPDTRLRGVALPLGEGFYVPVREKLWQDFALQQSPINTMETLAMPLWGLDYGERSLTYILLNPFDNQLAFERQRDGLGIRLTHAFQCNYAEMRYGVMVVPGRPSPIESARIYRDWLVETGRFVSLKQKLSKIPGLERLFGAAHVYLWPGDAMDDDNVQNWPALIGALRRPHDPRAARFAALLPAKAKSALLGQVDGPIVSEQLKTKIISDLNDVLRKRDLYLPGLWPPKSMPPPARALVERGVAKLQDSELLKLNVHLLCLTFPGLVADSSAFGGGVSPKMIDQLRTAGLDRLWLGVSDVDMLRYMPETVSAAGHAGYLFGPYDSYHSIHPPNARETWPTAQFDQELYDKGTIVEADGRRDHGFQGVGSHLSSIAAEPYVKRRVSAWMKEFGFNSYFVDCDATGELFDNYSPLYPATKEIDMQRRLERLAWIRDTYQLVIGSEVGAWFAAAEIHFGHGMMTPVFGYRDPLLRDPKSPYFMGYWYPAAAPTRFFTQTVLPRKYKDIYFDPRYRLPLYQAAFHDSIITTHHWEYPTWKFKNVQGVNELLELLYGVPPLYHLDMAELSKHRQEIQRHNAFFSPNYRRLATVPLSEFSWLTPDRMVQMAEFSREAFIIANFSSLPYRYQGHAVPPAGILLFWKNTGEAVTYTP